MYWYDNASFLCHMEHSYELVDPVYECISEREFIPPCSHVSSIIQSCVFLEIKLHPSLPDQFLVTAFWSQLKYQCFTKYCAPWTWLVFLPHDPWQLVGAFCAHQNFSRLISLVHGQPRESLWAPGDGDCLGSPSPPCPFSSSPIHTQTPSL